ncbi:hypothetical protein LIPSTDRAFT_147111 [Lipomyces starkeyi NRRL Y-11557]|uniref:Uncharacterized protein n=1 Tax=Lipomyces starkeyi NRRL Y-11557 TaxID=675824 RepID=A0A1E3Q1T9_LIPST|nr:hypothetical protein LIPSTDRAFT_147111 [Lipomyces starkeyi NRRL Y-11557]
MNSGKFFLALCSSLHTLQYHRTNARIYGIYLAHHTCMCGPNPETGVFKCRHKNGETRILGLCGLNSPPRFVYGIPRCLLRGSYSILIYIFAAKLQLHRTLRCITYIIS